MVVLQALCVVGEAIDLSSCDANVVASLLKQFLRELPDSLLTSRLQDRFEQVTSKFCGVCVRVCVCVCVCVCVYVSGVCVCACMCMCMVRLSWLPVC